MSRYSFRLYDGQGTSVREGIECRGLRAVRLQMLELARREMMTANGERAVWSMEALDDCGVVVGSMDFGLLSSTGYRR